MKLQWLLYLMLFQSLTGCKSNESIKTVLILGNSITRHGPLPKENWLGDWGMAASAASHDYVHRLEQAFPETVFKVKIVGNWERDFSVSYSGDPLTKLNPDLLLVRIGENVRKVDGFEQALARLISEFNGKRVIITGDFWPNFGHDSVKMKVAKQYGYEFLRLTQLSVKANKAVDQYPGSAVGYHPNDKGMEAIAYTIIEQIISHGLIYRLMYFERPSPIRPLLVPSKNASESTNAAFNRYYSNLNGLQWL